LRTFRLVAGGACMLTLPRRSSHGEPHLILDRLDPLWHGFTRKFAQSLANGFCDSVYERFDSGVLVIGYFCLHIFALIRRVRGNTMAKRWRQKNEREMDLNEEQEQTELTETAFPSVPCAFLFKTRSDPTEANQGNEEQELTELTETAFVHPC